MYKTGITGTIAAGKSSVSKILKRHGFPVFNADQYARMATHVGNPCMEQLINVLGSGILLDNGDIDRKKMADIIFHDEDSRKQVDAIIHPFVKEGMLKFFEKSKQSLVFSEVPLLFEAGWQDLFDEVCVVTCTKSTAVKRMMADRNYTKEQALARYNSQIDPDEQAQRADTVIHNDGTFKDLNKAVNSWLKELRGKSRNE